MCFHCSRVREQFASHHFSRHLPLHKWRCEAFVQLLCEQNPFHEAPDSQFTWCCCFRKQFGKMRTVLIHSLASFCGFVWSTTLCLSCHCSWFMAGQSTLLISVLPDGNAIAMQCLIHASVKDFGLVYGNQTLSSCYSDCPIVSCKKIWRYLQHNKVLQVCKMKGKVLRMTFAVRDM